MRPITLVFACLCMLFCAPALHAEAVRLAGRDVNLPVPQGYCVAKEDGAEGQVVSRIRHGIGVKNRLLLVFAQCDELKAMRAAQAGKADDGIRRYGTYTALAPDGEAQLFDQYDRQQFIRMIASGVSSGQVVSDSLKRAQERIRNVRDIKQLESLGVLDVDANALYFGLVGVRGGSGEHILAVGGATLVKGVNLSVTRYQHLGSPDDLVQLLTQQKAHLSSIVLANN